MYCENCGTSVNPGSKFCSACGNKIKSAEISPPDSQSSLTGGRRQNSSYNVQPILLISIPALLLIIVGASLIIPSTFQSTTIPRERPEEQSAPKLNPRGLTPEPPSDKVDRIVERRVKDDSQFKNKPSAGEGEIKQQAPPSSVVFNVTVCAKVGSYRNVRGDVPPQIDLSVDETTKAILAQAAQFAQANCPKDPEQPPPQANMHPRDWLHGEEWRRKWFQTNFPNLVGRSLANIDVNLYQGEKDHKVHARNYDTYQLDWREYTNRPLKARLRAEAEKRSAEEQARREAQQRAEQTRLAKEQADREAARQNRWNEFVRRYGIQEMVDANALTVNPFAYQGKTVAVHTQFERMVSPDTGLFAGNIMVTGLPRDLFKAQNIVVLVGRVMGISGQVPQLKFVAVHLCRDYGCSDLLAQR